MWTYHAERLVVGELSAVRAAVAAIGDRLWGDRRRPLLDEPHQRIDAIGTDPGSEKADVWLTWRLSPHAAGTWVELRLDELAGGPDPLPDLWRLLDAVATSVLDTPLR